MRSMMCRVLCLALVLMLVMAPTAQAARMAMDGREVRYGTINVVGVDEKLPSSYRGARDDDNGIVYIHGDDFADIVGAQLTKTSTVYEYSLGNWESHVRPDKGTAIVCYDFEPNEGSIHGNQLYSEFELTDCLYDELNDVWYFPFEEMMYMLALQWACIEGNVFVYRPETLLDVLCEAEDMIALRPGFEDLMGEEWWEQWGNAAKWGIASSIDELDMTFLWNGIKSAAAAGEDFYTEYETEVLTNALLKLQSDVPADPNDAFMDGTDKIGTFVSAVSNTVELSGEMDEAFEATNSVLQKCLNVRFTKELMQTLAPALGVGGTLISYGLSVGQTQYIRDSLLENFAQRLTYIEEVAQGREEDDSFYTWLKETASDAYDTYYGSAFNILADNMSWDSLANLVDNTLQMGGVDLASNKLVKEDSGILVLRWMNLAVTTIDLGIEVMGNVFPPFASALEKGDNAHVCRYLINIGGMMEKEFRNLYHDLKLDFTQEGIEDVRTSLQLMLSSSLHSAEILVALERWQKPADGYQEAYYLYRLQESSKYDKLLMMDSDFSDIVSDEDGCVRHDIPVEYVRIIEPVIITTETFSEESEHFEAEIVRPHVYAMANENLTAAIDEVLDPIYKEAMEDVEKGKKSAAACKYDMQVHHEIARLTSAYSNGGFVSLTLGTGYFNCGIGHNVYETTAYVFDVASGAILDLPDLLNTKENPDAEKQFLKVLDAAMDATGSRITASHDPSDVSARDLYEEMLIKRYATWDISPDGIYISIEHLNMDLMIHGLLLRYEDLEGILKEEYLPDEYSGAASYEMAPVNEALLEKDAGVTVYNNSPAVTMLQLNGLADHVWIRNSYGRSDEEIDGSCSWFYGYGVQNAIIALPEPMYDKYGYTIMWKDSQGDHIEDVMPVK